MLASGGPTFAFFEKSSIKIISLINSGGDRCKIETTVRNNVECASLWYAIIIDVSPKEPKSYSFYQKSIK